MPLLEFWPRQSHHLLQSGDQTVRAGETFEVSEEDVDELLANDEIRRPESAEAAGREPQEQDENATEGSQAQPLTHSPGRAERAHTTDRRLT